MRTKAPVLCCLLVSAAFACIAWGLYGLSEIAPLAEYVMASGTALPSTDEEAQSDLLTEMLEEARTSMPESLISAYTLKQGCSIARDADRQTTGSIYGIADGWFDVYHRTLLNGRLLGAQDIRSGKPLAVINTSLAYSLWGDYDILGSTFQLGAEEFTVIGVVTHDQQPGQTDRCEVYIPLQSARDIGLEADIQVISSADVSINRFEAVIKRFTSAGSLYLLQNEKARSMACLHYLCAFILFLILRYTFPKLRAYERRNHEECKNAIASSYGKQLLLPILIFLLKGLVGYGFWIGIAYVALSQLIAPLYTVQALLPEDISDLSGYVNAIRTLFSAPLSLHTLASENVLSMRYNGGLLKTGAVLMLMALGVRGGTKE